MTNLNYPRRENTPRLGKSWDRSHGADRLALEIARAQEVTTHQFSIVLVQFEGLSRATEGLGRPSGEGVWQRVLGALTGDVSANDLCCRLGEDEFMLVFPGRTESEGLALAERLRQRWTRVTGMRQGSLEM